MHVAEVAAGLQDLLLDLVLQQQATQAPVQEGAGSLPIQDVLRTSPGPEPPETVGQGTQEAAGARPCAGEGSGTIPILQAGKLRLGEAAEAGHCQVSRLPLLGNKPGAHVHLQTQNTGSPEVRRA